MEILNAVHKLDSECEAPKQCFIEVYKDVAGRTAWELSNAEIVTNTPSQTSFGFGPTPLYHTFSAHLEDGRSLYFCVCEQTQVLADYVLGLAELNPVGLHASLCNSLFRDYGLAELTTEWLEVTLPTFQPCRTCDKEWTFDKARRGGDPANGDIKVKVRLRDAS